MSGAGRILNLLAAFLVSYILAALSAGVVFTFLFHVQMGRPIDTDAGGRLTVLLMRPVIIIAAFTAVLAFVPSLIAAAVLRRMKARSATAYMIAGFVISIFGSLPLVGRMEGVGEMWPIYPAGAISGWVFWKMSRALGLRFEESAS